NPCDDAFPVALVSGRSIPEVFAARVAGDGERIAVTAGQAALTYAALERLARQVARGVCERIGDLPEPVGILVGQNARLPAAMFGVWMAGQIAAPLNPALPGARLAFMLGDLQARLLVTDAEHAARAAEV